jgi:maleylacetate reductase
VGVFAKAAMHTPIEVTDEAAAYLADRKADCVLAAGGGSTIGLGKALALRTGVMQIVLPTTYAGSECTPILGQTENGVKTTLKDPRVLPGTVLYDPELVATLPAAMTVTSALNAMAHAVEALYSQQRTAESSRLAMLGLQAFRQSLPAVMADPSDLAARLATQRGAWACGTVLGRVGMALHHKLCHTLGGSFDLPHAETHAIVLPHAVAYNAVAVPELLAPVAELFGGEDPAAALWTFSRSLWAPMALKDLGLAEADLNRAAEIATRNPYWNPREITQADVRALLGRAWSGAAPAA